MYLAYKDVAGLFQEKQGIEDNILFQTVADQANVLQPRGLFIPLSEESGTLSEAIDNGAIAAVWDKRMRLPHYTPNHFPIFFADEGIAAFSGILKQYSEKIDGETKKTMEITNFIFSHKKLLKKNKQTYDIAGILEKINSSQTNLTEKEGVE